MNYIVRVFIQRVLGILMFLLGSWWTMNLRAGTYFIGYFLITIISIIIDGLIVIRTYLEDKMLKEKLNGYEEYSHEVKYRLIPFIW